MDREAFKSRTLIIGNSGSGKSTLAMALSRFSGCPITDLDRIHWDSDTFATKRDEQIALQMTREAALGERWIIEGVYGWLAQAAIPRATALIWLNLPWEECQTGISQRGPWNKAGPNAMAALLEWAEAYYVRQTSSSLAGHLQMFERFDGDKFAISSRQSAIAFMARLQLH